MHVPSSPSVSVESADVHVVVFAAGHFHEQNVAHERHVRQIVHVVDVEVHDVSARWSLNSEYAISGSGDEKGIFFFEKERYGKGSQKWNLSEGSTPDINIRFSTS